MTKTSSDSHTGSAQTIAARLDRLPVGRWHRALVAVVGLGCFFNFFEVAIGTLMVPLLPAGWVATTWKTSLIIGSTFAGELVGALALTPLADRFGRRRMFQINLVGYAALAVVCAFSTDATMLIALRFALGVGLGAELALADAYLAELLPPSHRGRLATRAYAFGMLAVPAAGALATLLPHTMAGLASWRWLLLFSSPGAVIIWLLRRRLPESPRWLLSRGRADEAELALSAIEVRATGASGAPVTTSVPVAAETEPAPRLLRPPLLGRTVLTCLLETLGPVGFYGFASIAPLALLHKGFTVVESLGYTAVTALGYPAGAALLTLVVDRVQRRTLTIAASLGVAGFGVVFGLAGTTWLVVTAGIATSLLSVIQATVSRTYSAELFPTAVRSTILGRTYALSRLVAAILPLGALTVLTALGPGILYLLCAALIIAMSLSVAVLGPRTNATRLEDV
ncbi:MFS transporter [Amycolatopsis sp. NPDC051106]|uniref:MFS transporter n=1 Tax=unclassified Amycolatopsis TaxID=2618356 RepID=UPI0034462067